MNYREYIANRIKAEGVSAKEIEEIGRAHV